MKTALALLGLTTFALVRADAQDKKRVAVLDFEYQTVHQYVYDVFGSGKTSDGLLYYVMDYVRGVTPRQRSVSRPAA